MKVVCGQKKLSHALYNTQRCVAAKSSIAALEGILLRTLPQKLELTGYDMEMAMVVSIEAEVEERGEIVLSAKLFSEIVRMLPEDEPVIISVDERLTASITCGETHYTILGIPAHEFPELPAIQNTDSMEIDGKLLSGMIRQTKFAAAVGDTNPVHTGVMFEITPGQLRMIAVDGYRMAIRTEPVDIERQLSFIVPAKALGEVEKLTVDETETISIMVGKRHIMFRINDYMMLSRLLEGEFLDYKASIPGESATQLIMNTRRCIECIDRVSIVMNERVKSPIRCRFSGDTAFISCTTTLGEAKDQMKIELSGEDVEMGFNNRYLIEALKACDDPEVRVFIKGAVSPMKIMPCDGEAFLFLVLPMRLKA